MRRSVDRIKELIAYAHGIGFFHLMSANLLLQVAGFGMNIVLARILSKGDITRISVLQSFYGTFMLVGQLGITTAITKLCAEDIESGRREELMVTGIKMNLITSAIVVSTVFGLSFFNVFSPSDPIINSLMRIYIFQVPFVVLVYLLTGYLQAQQRIRTMSKYQVVIRTMVIISLIAASWQWALKGYVIAIVAANGAGFLLLMRISVIRPKQFFRYPVRRETVGRIFDFSRFSFLAGLIYQWTLNIGVLMANYYITENRDSIAVYAMALFFVNGIIMIPTSYNQIMIPKLSKVSDRLDIAWKLFADMRRKMYVLILLLFVTAQILVPIAIPILLGERYLESVTYFRVLSLGLLMWGIYSPIGNTLLSVGKVKYNVVSNIVVLSIQVIMNVMLIPVMGIMGMAISYVAGGTGAAVVNQIMLNRVFRDYKS